MHLERLMLLNFKNYSDLDLRFSPGVNCFTGPNGSGKTNLLDAVHYLGFSKSFLLANENQNIRNNEDFFQISGWFNRNDEAHEISCNLRRNQRKQFFRNKKEYGKLAEHIGLLPMVVSSPLDVQLLYDGSEERRRFLNSVISQTDRAYLNDLIAYNRILIQRNSLLRQAGKVGMPDELTLEIYNEQLAVLSDRIYNKRINFIQAFQPVFTSYYRIISDDAETITLNYTSQLMLGETLNLLKNSISRDLALGYTTQGIHKDDLDFQIEGNKLKQFGSQGQQKSFLVSLKLAQFEYLYKHHALKPILLLDDIFDKLDAERTRQLVHLVAEEHFGQIFITDTHSNRMIEILKEIEGTHCFFSVENGNINTIPG
jgi:DNA replication and repair protein RecF